jgi:hypothetical protein
MARSDIVVCIVYIISVSSLTLFAPSAHTCRALFHMLYRCLLFFVKP